MANRPKSVNNNKVSNSNNNNPVNINTEGSGCGAVGRAVASKTRDQRFESSYRLFYSLPINCIQLDVINKC